MIQSWLQFNDTGMFLEHGRKRGELQSEEDQDSLMRLLKEDICLKLRRQYAWPQGVCLGKQAGMEPIAGSQR